MSKRPNVPRIQHYVPRFLLKQFTFGKKHQLHVFDKRSDRVFIANVRKIAAEDRFYDFEFQGVDMTLEAGLSKLESSAKPLFDRMLQTDSTGCLSDVDRATLSAFFAVQFTRTRAFREQWRSIGNLLADQLQAWATTDEERASVEAQLSVRSDSREKQEQARFIATAPRAFAKHFFDKTWVLLCTDRKRPFLIGDNPLTLQNLIDRGPRGNLGLGVTGIEIYFPLSPTRALALWCPSHREVLLSAIRRRRSSLATQTGAAMLDDAMAFVRAMDQGGALPSEPENVLNFNSLQVRFAERYVFSSTGDFALATEMVESDEGGRIGPRPSVA